MSKEVGRILEAQLRGLPPRDPLKPVIKAQILENNAALRRLRSEEIARRAAELDRLRAIPPRIRFAPIEAEATVEHARELGVFVRDSFLGEVGDEVLIGEVFPRKQIHPPHELNIDAALDERWAPVYQQLGRSDKYRVSRAFELLEVHSRGGTPRNYPDSQIRIHDGNIANVGEVRALEESGIARLYSYNLYLGFGPQMSALLHAAFSRPPELLTDSVA